MNERMDEGRLHQSEKERKTLLEIKEGNERGMKDLLNILYCHYTSQNRYFEWNFLHPHLLLLHLFFSPLD